MKSLHEYLIQEKLKLNKDIKVRNQDMITIDVPKYNDGDIDNNIWKNIEIPYKKWIIYHDAYHGSLLHFACLGDFLCQFVMFQDDYSSYFEEDDYEDTPINAIIEFASDNLDEAFKWYVNKLENLKIIKFSNNEFTKSKAGTYDCEDFFNNVNNGTWDENDLTMGMKQPTLKDLEDFPNWIKKYF